MKHVIVLAILLVLIGGCSRVQEEKPIISGTQELILNEQDLQLLGMSVGTDCQTDNAYSNIVDSSTGQYTFCNYTINSLKDTEVIIQLQRFMDKEALEGSYQYDSSHLYSIEGIISEDVYGDKSRFRMNNKNDYMGELNEPGVYNYHLWICKGLYLIHVTSGGRNKEVGDYIPKIGQKILSKFE